MFDNQLNGTGGKGQTPTNLPFGEPDDMFSSAGVSDGVPTTTTEPPSALEAGVLRPKTQAAPRMSTMPQPERAEADTNDFEVMSQAPTERVRRVEPPVADAPSTYPEYRIQEPSIFKSIFLVIVVVLLVAGVGFGGWWAYSMYVAPRLNNSENLPSLPDDTTDIPSDVTPTPVPADDSDNDPNDDAILFGNVPDTDGDGLDDLRERELGTDPMRFDTDGDGLSDYDEVISWKSNPQNPDTDGDGYSDEEEIKNGYSPVGPGRIFEPPTSTPAQQ